MKATKKIATIKDIAKELGISATAVSKALNNKGGISEEMVKKIKETAKRLDYKPNVIAKSLKLNKTKTIGVIISDSSHTFFPKVIKGIEDAASKEGYSIILCNTDSVKEKEKKALNVLISKRIDGVILAASMLTHAEDYALLKELDIPFVFLIRRSEVESADYVINDNVSGAYLMANYLLRYHRKIHFFNIKEYNISAVDRLIGYKKALEENGVQYDPSLVLNMNPEIEDGYTAMRQLLEKGEDVKAVFCGCDVISIGVMEAIIEKGLKIPEDIQVAGYDDIDFAAYLRVPLTTIRQPKYSIGCKGTELLINKIRNKVDGMQHVVLKPELVVRQST
ncbi:LacI family DNA-binding transcriptional regulator [Petroclostridium sp. X23]|uniref:LacI family DNA-binding transcriptional regulator n=1 Tax=Petroclostridium sp. X23 TaxID=3045146 RepID=UPI0024ACF05A|nr:LacI family DNA-binding transcriptional regulator [Petroclostridium sp. X23]WHH59100.1 LacI family DNA-binding transcriptional regulator [Petroclostridium sp. X23]